MIADFECLVFVAVKEVTIMVIQGDMHLSEEDIVDIHLHIDNILLKTAYPLQLYRKRSFRPD